MHARTKLLTLTAVFVVIILASLSLFTVSETERGIVLRLGKLIIDPKTKQPKIVGAGLRIKMPLIDSVHLLDRRIQSLPIQSSRIPTEEKKELIVDLFTKWRIVDFSKFYTSTGGKKATAERLLREKIVDGLRAEIGRRKLNSVVSQDRQNVMDKIRVDVNNKAAKPLGIEVVDVRIVRIDLPQEVSEAVFNLMKTERQRVAAEHRAQGRARAEAIRADADAREIIIGATAERDANTQRGQGDAKASEIYANVYNQDSEFYSFYRSLEAYRETFKRKNDILVLRPDDYFFKYFRNAKPNSNHAG